MSELNSEIQAVIRECIGNDVTSDGLRCPHCGADETYKDANDPNDVSKWVFAIRAFRVDDASHCMNCDKWFES